MEKIIEKRKKNSGGCYGSYQVMKKNFSLKMKILKCFQTI